MLLSHHDVIRGANFILVMFKLKPEAAFCSRQGGGASIGGNRRYETHSSFNFGVVADDRCSMARPS